MKTHDLRAAAANLDYPGRVGKSTKRSTDRGLGTDRRVGLTPEKIVDAAMELSKGSGLNSWTQRDLAASLDVSPSVLYHHIGGRDEVVRGVVERVAEAFRPPDPALSWQDWFRSFLLDARPPLVDYPGAAKWLLMHGPTFPSVSGTFDTGISKLAEAGFDRPAIAYAMLLNSAMLAVTMSDDRLELGDDGPRDHSAMLSRFEPLAEQSPGMSRMVQEMLGPLARSENPAEDPVNDQYYRLLIEVLISGLEAQLAVSDGAV